MVQRKRRLRVIVPGLFHVEEPAQSCNLRRQVHHDDLHPDVELELEQVLTRLQRLVTRRHKHVACESQFFQAIYQLAKFRAPSEDSKLAAVSGGAQTKKKKRLYLAILFEASVYDIGSGL
jgi:hypothetical protein